MFNAVKRRILAALNDASEDDIFEELSKRFEWISIQLFEVNQALPKEKSGLIAVSVRNLDEALSESHVWMNKTRKSLGNESNLGETDKDHMKCLIAKLNQCSSDLTNSLSMKLPQSSLKDIQQRLKVSSDWKSHVQQHLKSFNYQSSSRAWLHEEVDEWLAATPSNGKDLKNKMFWLQAGAGMGKSVFTAALIDRLDLRSLIVGAVFIKFNDEKQSNPIVILKSLVCQLAVKFPETQSLILRKLEDIEFETESVQLIFDKVLLEALLMLDDNAKAEKRVMNNMLIIIDALDEAGTEGSMLRRSFLGLFSTNLISRLPIWVKIFVSGRPEVDLIEKFHKYAHVIDEKDPRHIKDLIDYIDFSLREVLENDAHIDTARDIMLEKCENKFLYTALIAERISEWYSEDGDVFSENNFIDKLKELPSGIDDSYMKTFEKLYESTRRDLCHQFLLIMVSSLEALTKKELKYFLNINDEHEFKILVDHVVTVFPLRGVDEANLKFYPFHKSVIDWLTNSDRSKLFFCNVEIGNMQLASSLLDRIELNDSRFIDVDIDIESIKVGANLLRVQQQSDNIEDYLFKNLLTHLDKCKKLKYRYVTHFLLTYLPWIQSSSQLLGVPWLIKEYLKRFKSEWLPDEHRYDMDMLGQCFKLFATSLHSKGSSIWASEVCSQIVGRLKNCRQSSRINLLVNDATTYIKTKGGWLVENGNFQRAGSAITKIKCQSQLQCLCLLSESFVATLYKNGSIRLWNIESGEYSNFNNVIKDAETIMYIKPHFLLVKTSNSIEKWNYWTENCEIVLNTSLPVMFMFPNENICLVDNYTSTLLMYDKDLNPILKSTNFENCNIVLCLNNDTIVTGTRKGKYLQIWKLVGQEITLQYKGSYEGLRCLSKLSENRFVVEYFKGFAVWDYSPVSGWSSQFLQMGHCTTVCMCELSDCGFVIGLDNVALIAELTGGNWQVSKRCNIGNFSAITHLPNTNLIISLGYNEMFIWDATLDYQANVWIQRMYVMYNGCIVTESIEGIVALWNEKFDAMIWQRNSVCSADLKDGRIACGTMAGALEIWNITSLQLDYKFQIIPLDIYGNPSGIIRGMMLLANGKLALHHNAMTLFDVQGLTWTTLRYELDFKEFLPPDKYIKGKSDEKKIPFNVNIHSIASGKLLGSLEDDAQLYRLSVDGLFLTVPTTNKSFCVVYNIANSEMKNFIVDMDMFPDNSEFPLYNHIFYHEDQLVTGLKIPNSNRYLFRSGNRNVIMASKY